MAALLLLAAGCSETKVSRPVPVELGSEDACTVCGMIAIDYPGPTAQIHYENGKVDVFCCTLDMFTFYLSPGRPKHITEVFVNDMAKADWKKPEGHWIDARDAFYVFGGNVMVAMGEALVPFLDQKDAEVYRKEHGGKIVMFDEVSMGMLRPVH